MWEGGQEADGNINSLILPIAFFSQDVWGKSWQRELRAAVVHLFFSHSPALCSIWKVSCPCMAFPPWGDHCLWPQLDWLQPLWENLWNGGNQNIYFQYYDFVILLGNTQHSTLSISDEKCFALIVCLYIKLLGDDLRATHPWYLCSSINICMMKPFHPVNVTSSTGEIWDLLIACGL